MYADTTVDDITSEVPELVETMKSFRPLLTEHTSRTDGVGPAIDLGADCGKLLVVTLGINRVVEHGGLTLSIWGSADGRNWGSKPVAAFPQKYYCGLYSVLLSLVGRPEIRFLRPQWNMKAWDKASVAPLFSFHLFLEESGARLSTAVA